MINIKDTDLTFIPIPKCGGTSITQALKEKYEIEKCGVGVHSGTYNYDKGKEYVVSVRNPYDRCYSHYHFYVEWIKKMLDGELPLKRNKRTRKEWLKILHLLEEIEFSGWVLALTDQEVIDYYVDEYGIERDAFRCQVDWFKDTNKPVHIHKIEEGTIWQFLNITQKHLKKSTYKTVEYTQKQKDIVYEYYKDDFKRIGYK